jgi:hypothetical protein
MKASKKKKIQASRKARDDYKNSLKSLARKVKYG